MESDCGPEGAGNPPIIVPELRDYHQINAELVRRLNLGQRHVRLERVEGQRLLASRLAGSWQAVVEVDGSAGPELAAELNCPGLIVVCRGSAADGAGRGLVAGTLVISQSAGTALGYFQEGGLIVALADAGPRAGLNQKGGGLVLLGRCGPLAGERQRGGLLFLKTTLAGHHLGFGASQGRRIDLSADGFRHEELDPNDRRSLETALDLANRYRSTS